jgi:hypothetical protein
MTSSSRMPSDSSNGRLASTLVSPDRADVGGGGMVRRELTTHTSAGVGAASSRRMPDRRRGPIALLTAVTSGLRVPRDTQTPRERFEHALGHLIRARSVVVREDGVAHGHSVCVNVPGYGPESRARLEVTFEPGRTPGGWTRQLLEVGAHIAALLLEVERAQARFLFRVKPAADGAAPLIGSSHAIKTLRERIERVAATDFTVLIEGASGPQPHPSLIEVFGEAAFG